MADFRPHPSNVPGEYFVEDGCCLTCDVPFAYAPDLFDWECDAGGRPVHCYIKVQPMTTDEHDRMFEVIRRAEADCILYRGRDRAIQERLVEAGSGVICTNLPDDLRERSVRASSAMGGSAGRPWRDRLRRIWSRLCDRIVE